MSFVGPYVQFRLVSNIFSLEFGAQASKQLQQVLFNPSTAHSVKFEDAALPASYGFQGSFFDYVELPGNERHLVRFAAAMASLTAITSPDAVLEGA